jgi:hypothetical protein
MKTTDWAVPAARQMSRNYTCNKERTDGLGEGENSDQDREKCRSDGGELGAFPEWRCNEKRPAGQRQPEEDINKEKESSIRLGPNLVMPDNSNYDPRRQVHERKEYVG